MIGDQHSQSPLLRLEYVSPIENNLATCKKLDALKPKFDGLLAYMIAWKRDLQFEQQNDVTRRLASNCMPSH